MVVFASTSSSVLAAQAMQGNSAALDLLLARLGPEVTRITRSIAPGSWVAEEAAQEALIDIVSGIGRLRDPESVVGWARTIAARRVRDALKKEAAHGAEPLDPQLLGPGMNLATMPLIEAFRTLPTRQRAVAGLRLIRGLGESEVSEVLEIARGTVKFHVSAARRHLRAELQERGMEPELGRRPR
jgi:RNA polymerase sigma-70 factor (ECF subfamily)